MKPRPRVSVLLPVRNGFPYLRGALESVLAQTMRDFELLVIDNDSTDDSPQYLRALDDPRIRYHRLGRVGLPAALNYGLREARASVIARMDADDICHPERLEHQLAFLERHQEVVIVGCQSTLIDTNGVVTGERRFPIGDMAIRWQMGFGCPFQQPGVMYRLEPVLAADGYLKEEYPADDYGLCARLAKRGQMANLDRMLLKYRIHPNSITLSMTADQREHCSRIAADYACASAVIDRTAFRDLYQFLTNGACPHGDGFRLEVAFTSWRNVFATSQREPDLAYWMNHVQRRLRWHCLEHAQRHMMRPVECARWVRLASRFDPEKGTLRSIVGRALRKLFGSTESQRESTIRSHTVGNVVVGGGA